MMIPWNLEYWSLLMPFSCRNTYHTVLFGGNRFIWSQVVNKPMESLHYVLKWIKLNTVCISWIASCCWICSMFITYSKWLIGRCSLVFWASIMQDKDLNEYNPSDSSTSKPLSCSHRLCKLGLNCPNPKQQCPYSVNYYSDDTSTSGFLVEDVLHLVPGHNDASNESVKAPVIIGCVFLCSCCWKLSSWKWFSIFLILMIFLLF